MFNMESMTHEQVVRLTILQEFLRNGYIDRFSTEKFIRDVELFAKYVFNGLPVIKTTEASE